MNHTPPIVLEIPDDRQLSEIVVMMNTAFRATDSDRGWSLDVDYIGGERINHSLLREEIAKGAVYLVARQDETGFIQGCVSLQTTSPDTWYLGSLTVTPALQNSGFGRALLSAAEEYAEKRGAHIIQIAVVHVRQAPISWYERRGYKKTGETRPFPYGDHRYGTPRRSDLRFVVLEKALSA